MSNIFDRLPSILVQVNLTTQEQDYLRRYVSTLSPVWTHAPPPEAAIAMKLNAAVYDYHLKEVGLAEDDDDDD